MNQIFVSYANADRKVAQQMADALEALGLSVWWDREIPFGKPFDQVIEEELNSAQCVLVLWSRESVKSRWVKTEAGAAADRERLIPVLIEDVVIPLEFRRIQTAMLQGWNGDRTNPEFLQLVESIRQMTGQPDARPLTSSRPGRASRSQSPIKRNAFIAAAAGVLVLAVIAFGVSKFSSSPREVAPSPASSGSPAPATSTVAQPAAPPTSSATGASPTQAVATPAVKGAYGIRIGDRIEDGVPAAGAGNIETAGAKDVYTFNASAGQRVYFRMLAYGKGMEQIGWKVTDPDDAEVFDTRLGYTEPGVYTLKKPGMYKMIVGSDREPATGTYHLQLFNVPAPQQFSIKVGDAIREDTPKAGAGEIESPGAKDIYSFTASPGQRVYFRRFEYGRGMDQINWKLTDADATEIFDSRLGYTEPGVYALRKGGTYTLMVGADRDPHTGSYHLQLFDVPPPQQFAIKIGDTITPDKPARGAGHIESPGAKDVYTFTATAGQRVYFRKLEHDRGMEQIAWTLIDSDGTVVFDSRLGYTEPGAKQLHKGGTYKMTVGSDREPVTGTYHLQLSPAGLALGS